MLSHTVKLRKIFWKECVWIVSSQKGRRMGLHADDPSPGRQHSMVTSIPEHQESSLLEDLQASKAYKDEDLEDRKGFKFDETLDLGAMLSNYMPVQVVNENRVRPRKFVKMGRNTVEEPGGEAEPPGSPNPSPESLDMAKKILQFFKSRDRPPEPEMKPFRPGKRPMPAARVAAPEVPTGQGPLAQITPKTLGDLAGRKLAMLQGTPRSPSKLSLLAKAEKNVAPKAPPPRANYRSTFKPQPPKTHHIPQVK